MQIKGHETYPTIKPYLGQRVFIDVLENGVYNEFTFHSVIQEVGSEDDEDNWLPEVWKFIGTGTYYHYPVMGEFKGYILTGENPNHIN